MSKSNNRPPPSRLKPRTNQAADRQAADDTGDDDDPTLFREMVGEVRSVRDDRDRSRPRPPPARPLQTEASERAVKHELLTHPIDYLDVETGEEISYLRDGLQTRVLRRLRRGDYAVGGELDLHELNAEAARSSIASFLLEAADHGVRCVKIIHGKGLRSKHKGPVLKILTNGYLRRRSDVLAFTSARPNDGGTGAVYVLLKS